MTPPAWIQWVRWCNADQGYDFTDNLVLSLIDLTEGSQYKNPVIAAHLEEEGHIAAGYLVIHPGALGSLGNMRFLASKHATTGESTERLESQLLARITRKLCDQAFQQGAELVQAISTLVSNATGSDVLFDALDSPRDIALVQAGMLPVAKLVQMECNVFPLDVLPSSSSTTNSIQEFDLEFKPYDQIPIALWHEVIEGTYHATLDVPELNGKRGIENTLEGYGSTLNGRPTTWWVIQTGGVNIGCLLLTPKDLRMCELTYLGLIPKWRGQGLSKSIMKFTNAWLGKHEVERMTLAVDVRNVPAIRLYQSFGFVAERFVQAWIACRTKILVTI